LFVHGGLCNLGGLYNLSGRQSGAALSKCSSERCGDSASTFSIPHNGCHAGGAPYCLCQGLILRLLIFFCWGRDIICSRWGCSIYRSFWGNRFLPLSPTSPDGECAPGCWPLRVLLLRPYHHSEHLHIHEGPPRFSKALFCLIYHQHLIQ
jgi:hypothetical protein